MKTRGLETQRRSARRVFVREFPLRSPRLCVSFFLLRWGAWGHAQSGSFVINLILWNNINGNSRVSPGILRISAEYVQRVDISRPIGPFFARIWTGPPANAHQAFRWLKNRIAVFEITDSDLGAIQTNDVPT